MSCVFEVALLMDIMVMAVLYLWCSNNKDVIVRFWFGTQFKAMYLPWILFLFNLVIRGGGMDQLMGIFVGHVYFFLMFKYPQVNQTESQSFGPIFSVHVLGLQDFGGRQLIHTPQFLYKWFPSTRGGVHGFGRPPVGGRRDAGAAQGQGHQWGGSGHRLGGQ